MRRCCVAAPAEQDRMICIPPEGALPFNTPLSTLCGDVPPVRIHIDKALLNGRS